jgi:hypothetical protein
MGLTLPAANETNWSAKMNTAVRESAKGTLLGALAIDDFGTPDGTSTTDVAMLNSALAVARADTYPRTLVLSNRQYDFSSLTGGVVLDWNGARFKGPLGGTEREFRETNRIICPSGGLFRFSNTGVRDFSFDGLAFQASGSGVWMAPFATDNSGGSWQDVDITNCGFQGFSNIFSGTTLRMDINRTYINGATNTQLNVGGSDNKFFTYGRCFTSGTLPSSAPWFDFGVSSSDINLTYVTPQTGYAARFNYTQGGVNVIGGKSDCTGRSGALATQQAGILQNIPAGRSITYYSMWVFNAGQNGSSTGSSKALIQITGGDAVFYSPNFPGTMTGTTPAVANIPGIYAAAGCNVRVHSPRAENGGYKHLRQAAANLIYCDDPSWTIDTLA